MMNNPLFLKSCIDADLLKSKAYIGGEWIDSKEKTYFTVLNPADNQLITQLPNLGPIEAIKAIEAASNALRAWREKTGKERALLLRRWFDLILEHQEPLAMLMTAEQGKPLSEARAEVNYGAAFIEWFAEEAKRIYGDVTESSQRNTRMLTLKQPVGVCIAITPWNFPLAMITRKVAPALAAGCTIVVKPAEQTPLTALALAELAQRAGIPDGVFNILTADENQSIEIGKTLCASPLVRHLSFTGSTSVGRILLAQCAPTVKKVTMELGGHAPFIVFDDADIQAAVNGALWAKYRNSGQTCISPNRFYVQEKIHDAFVTELVAATKKLQLNNGFAEKVDIGPLINAAAVAKVKAHIDDAQAKGGAVVCGGNVVKEHWIEPTVITGATHDMRLATEETFGPVAAIFKFRDEEEAIARANDTESGLAAYFYTKDIDRIWRVAEALEYGMVGLNTGTISGEMAPFGGIKQSGLGREGSRYGIEEYLELKYICQQI